MTATLAPSRVGDLVEDFVAAKRAAGLSPRTVTDYAHPLRRYFVPFCATLKVTEPSEITQRVVDRFSTDLQSPKREPVLARASVNTYLKSVQQFVRWLREEGELADAKVNTQPLRVPRRLLDTLTRAEIQAMEDAARTERDKLIIRVLADTGLRLGELRGLTVESIVERDRQTFLRVDGKTGPRDMPIPKLHRRLRRFVETGRGRTAARHIFLSNRKSARSGERVPLTEKGVGEVVRNAAEEAGLTKRVYPHLLRHSFATWSLQNGMNMVILARLMGHSSLTMINNVYAHLTPSDSYDAMARLLAGGD